MKLKKWASEDVHTNGGGKPPPSVGLTPNAIPETKGVANTDNSQKGVSTQCVLPKIRTLRHKQVETPHWYALRTTYGREKKAYDYMVARGIEAFLPTIISVKQKNGKRRVVIESRLPNIFFAYGTEEQLKTFVYDNVNLPFLRFYYRHIRTGGDVQKQPLVVPDYQMESLRIICEAESSDTIVSVSCIPKFETGQLVRVKEGNFAGVVGRVARFQGQQRVGIIVDGLVTACTAYIPNAFLEPFWK